MVGGAAAFVRATGALAHSASTGHLALQGIGMRVLPPPLCDRSAFRQLVSVDLASNCITALPLGIFMWLLQLQSLILDRNKITSFPFCLFLKTHVVIHDAPPAPPSAHSAANLTAFPCARPLKISCQHNPLKDPFVRMARGDAAGPCLCIICMHSRTLRCFCGVCPTLTFVQFGCTSGFKSAKRCG